MKIIFQTFFLSLICTGCALAPLKPGHSAIKSSTGFQGDLKQSQNPQSSSTQKYKRTTETDVAPGVPVPQGSAVHSKTVEESETVIGAAQKDTAREIGAKLASLKSVVWVGIVVFLFGAASAFYPPLKLIVGSVTTSAVACVAGIVLIILPSLVVGHEILILAVGGGAVVIYFFAHRHGQLRGTVESLLKKV